MKQARQNQILPHQSIVRKTVNRVEKGKHFRKIKGISTTSGNTDLETTKAFKILQHERQNSSVILRLKILIRVETPGRIEEKQREPLQ